MSKVILSVVSMLCIQMFYAQDFTDGEFVWQDLISHDLGMEEMSSMAANIDPISYQGELNDFSGGYQIGDTVADFTVWNGLSQSYSLSENLQNAADEGKYTILFTGSNSCVRFTDFWNGSDDAYSEERQFVQEHINDFNWNMIYGIEAHPIDVENCSSNCPQAIFAGPSGVGEMQHQEYFDRLQAMNRWTGVHDGSIIIPETISTYTPGQIEPTGTTIQNYSPGFPNINVWMDNIDNAVYDTFFKRPFGVIVIDCKGVVVERADWVNTWLGIGEHGGTPGMVLLEQLLEADPPECAVWEPYCNAESIDTDNDGYCDDWEQINETDADDICSPDGTDNDEDGLCNNLEEVLGTNPDSSDTDEDGVSDAEELENGTDPLVSDVIVDSVSELLAQVKLFPNPVSDVLTISLPNAINAEAVMIDLTGKKMTTALLQSSDSQLDVSDLDSGVYILEIRLSTGEMTSNRIIIE